MKKITKNKSGFTLVELAIVIVIVGLLVGGVLQGQNLIEAARVRGQVKQIEQLKSYRLLYYSKFNAYPGDDPKAFTYWNTDCAATNVLCNGNGNQKPDTYNETYMFWKHLSLAKILQTNFTGTLASDGLYYKAGENIPAGVYEGSGVQIGVISTVHYGQLTDFNLFEFGKRRSSDGNYRLSVVTPEQAYQIDVKYDDGIASSGKVLVTQGTEYSPDPTKCVDGFYWNTIPVNYILSDTTISCRIMFIYN